MKIIAERKIGDYSRSSIYIAEVSYDEVMQLTGWIIERGSRDIRVPCEIKVSEMFSQLRNLADKQHALKQTAESLRALAGLLETYDPIVADATTPKDGKAEVGS